MGRPRSPRGAEGYPHGPAATLFARADALDRVASAHTLVLVEGISDVIALEALAERIGRDLAHEGVVVVPMGGAQAISGFLREYGPTGEGRRLVGLCDAGEAAFFRRAVAEAGLGSATDGHEMERLGFFVCVDDLEAELIRASDPAEIERLLAAHGDLGSFRTLQKQAAWCDRPFEAQMHRWLRAGAGRNLRYARLLVEHVASDRLPAPLVEVLAAAGPR